MKNKPIILADESLFLKFDQADLRLAEIQANKAENWFAIKYGMLCLGLVVLITMCIPLLLEMAL